MPLNMMTLVHSKHNLRDDGITRASADNEPYSSSCNFSLANSARRGSAIYALGFDPLAAIVYVPYMRVWGPLWGNTRVTVEDSVVDGNKAYQGALFASAKILLRVHGTNVTKNHAVSHGGGVALDGIARLVHHEKLFASRCALFAQRAVDVNL